MSAPVSVRAVPMPSQIAALPRDRHGRPVPWFVAHIDGEPDFRVVRAGGIAEALEYQWCWVCGRPLYTRFKAFLVGPMCTVNRTSAEPPSHRDCAVYSAMACPFLATPNMTRRESNLPEDHVKPGGVMLLRNPGVGAVWMTTDYTRYRANGGDLFRMGDPTSVLWFARGRSATRAEVEDSFASGFPLLSEVAEAEGPDALAELERMYQSARELMPEI